MAIDWKDRVVQYPNRYQLKDTTTGNVVATYDIVPYPGTVTETGTYITAANMKALQEDIVKVVSLGGLQYI